MSQLLKKQIFGEIPDDFDALLIRACNHEPEVKSYRRPTRALVIVLCILLLAGTAFAVGRGLKIVDLFGVGSVDEKEAKMVIDTAVAQRGGVTSIADFTVREAFYDGTFLRFVIESNNKQEAVLLNAGFMMLKETEETSGLPGKRYGVQASMDSPDVYLRFPGVSMRYIEESLYLFTNSFLFEGAAADRIELSVSIDLLDVDDSSIVESTTLSFTVKRTATPITKEYDLSFDTDYVRLEKVTIAKTPLEIIASLEYRPLLRAFGNFTLVPEDGYVVKDNHQYSHATNGSLPNMADGGKTTMQYVLPVDQGNENVLTLWITNTDQAIQIDLDTGEATACTVSILPEGNDVKIEKVEE